MASILKKRRYHVAAVNSLGEQNHTGNDAGRKGTFVMLLDDPAFN